MNLLVYALAMGPTDVWVFQWSDGCIYKAPL